MGLDKVVSNIRSEGKAQAEATLAQARAAAEVILADARRQADDVRSKRAAQATVTAEALIRREAANADLEARRLRLTVERELMTNVRSAIEQRLAALPPKAREEHIKTLVAKAHVQDGRVFVAKQDESTARSLGLNVVGTFDGLGGVIVESPDHATRENLRYETLLDEIWATSLPAVADKLLKA
ncbi:MAG: V-type ATP synthase subunit E family protein, partial [Candidatus Thermoplasmatota archaeon]